MDLLSVIQTAEAVINAAHRYTASLKDSPRSIERLTNKLKSVTPLLNDIRKLCKDYSDLVEAGSQSPQIESLRSLVEDDGQLKDLQTATENIQRLLNSKSPVSSKWQFYERLLRLVKREKEEKDCKALLDDLEEFKSSASLVLQIISINDRKRRDEIRLQEQQQRDILAWLKPYEYNAKHDSSSQSRHAGTCAWLWENDTFSAWRSGTRSELKFLWLCGIPGSGKTTLASAVVDDLEKASNMTTAYHYCDFMNTESILPVTILRSIFIQLLRRSGTNWIESFSDLVSRRKEGKGPPTGLSDLVDLIYRASKHHTHTIIVVDGLDECYADSNRETLIRGLRSLSVAYGLSVFATSRDEQEIRSGFVDLPSLSLTDVKTSVEADIKIFVENELNVRPRLSRLRDDLKDKITRILVEKADGMFQWARCQVNTINDCLTEENIEHALETLPKDLSETYERILKKILERGEGVAARKILMWLIGSYSWKPLSLLQLHEAMMVEPSKTERNEKSRLLDPLDIIRICGGLIQSYTSNNCIPDPSEYPHAYLDSLTKEDNYHVYHTTLVRISHYTVKEFLLAAPWTDTRLSLYHLLPRDVHTELTLFALTYLGLDIFFDPSGKHECHFPYPPIADIFSKHRFGLLHSYCSWYWSYHLCYAKDSDAVYQALLQIFTKDDKNIVRSISRSGFLDPWYYPGFDEKDSSGLEVLILLAIKRGCVWLLKRLLTDYPALTRSNPCIYGNPLTFAFAQDRLEVITTLLDFGMEHMGIEFPPDALEAKQYYSKIRPLHLAIIKRSLPIFNILMNQDIDIHARCERAPESQLAASLPVITLHVAARFGTPDIVTTLMQRGLDPKEVDEEGRNALHYVAFQRDHGLEIARKLLQAGVNPMRKDNSGKMPLHYAFNCRSPALIECILSEANLESTCLSEMGTIHSREVEWAVHEPWYSHLVLTE